MKVHADHRSDFQGQDAAHHLQAAPGLQALKGKVAVVTGASSGIGRACASALTELGMRVAACARRVEKIEELRDQLVADGKLADPGRFIPLACNVQLEEDIQKVVANVQVQCLPCECTTRTALHVVGRTECLRHAAAQCASVCA